MKVAVLFTEKNSIYEQIPDADCYDIDRDALTFPGGIPVIAHPPCRLWGKLYKLSTAPESEKDLARFAVDQVRKWGGVLEHPAHSKLWKDQGLPLPGDYSDPLDFTLDIDQFWFGHMARKRTWLYIHGVTVNDLPPYALNLNLVTYVIDTSRREKNARGQSSVLVHTKKQTSIDACAACDMACRSCKTSRRVTVIASDAYYQWRDEQVRALIAQNDALMEQEPIDWPEVEKRTQEMRRLVGLPEDYGEVKNEQ